MGYTRHNAIIVTGPAHTEAMEKVRAEVARIAYDKGNVCSVTPLTAPSINHYCSFLVAPDGSKEGWDSSDEGDATRDVIVAYLNTLRYGDGSTSFKFVEVQFGDDNKEAKVLRNSDDPVTVSQ